MVSIWSYLKAWPLVGELFGKDKDVWSWRRRHVTKFQNANTPGPVSPFLPPVWESDVNVQLLLQCRAFLPVAVLPAMAVIVKVCPLKF